ncbi:unnamed protein product [Polarella glacialis]|uniref:Dehydrogenase/reductase SDR family member 7B n=1 Tax=Polarella glacialis TaxID=89957 RepID=A0A813JMX3_POLGL|nr:unnamed protein product [Polarella glacialis]CAE8685361.1 unnamed protein product [Polarella glacialis]
MLAQVMLLAPLSTASKPGPASLSLKSKCRTRLGAPVLEASGPRSRLLPGFLGLGALGARRRDSAKMGLSASFFRSDAAEIREYFEGKVVWVTGASGGFGEALAVALSSGARLRGLVLSARRQVELERVKARCLELCPGLEISVLPLDLSKLTELPAAAQAAAGFYGRVDVLVNNGGVGFRGLGCETSIEIDQQVMNVDYFSGVVLVKALLPDWLVRRSGHVVQISSVQGFFGLPGRTAYSAAKHAAVGFYDSLRAEVADSGISVTTVCPGYIATDHSRNAAKGEGVKYPEGHTSKGVAPEVLAPKALAAAARRQPELVAAPPDARLAILLRTLCPTLLFFIMRRRARKEQKERTLLLQQSAGEAKKGS